MSSPHAWGCFQPEGSRDDVPVVFPTRVGVFLGSKASHPRQDSLPHTRGGVSEVRNGDYCVMPSSPHAWGCFPGSARRPARHIVFPTRVGVFPMRHAPCAPPAGLPHTRGGVSDLRAGAGGLGGSSPHAWGCFSTISTLGYREIVFPTRVGVFLVSGLWLGSRFGLPHTRGGVSVWNRAVLCDDLSSPHAWGCFCVAIRLTKLGFVFPTRVGVFPADDLRGLLPNRLPHTRGGVSMGSIIISRGEWSSPHAWGCFVQQLQFLLAAVVFPTRVGVFPPRWCAR